LKAILELITPPLTLARAERCPAEYWPCKHSLALDETYKIVPDTFIDIKAILKKIQRKTKPELLELIKKMIQCAPESLAALGIRERSGEEEEED